MPGNEVVATYVGLVVHVGIIFVFTGSNFLRALYASKARAGTRVTVFPPA